MPTRARPTLFASPNLGRRGHTLIEVLIALVVMTVIFVFISGDMMAISHEDKMTDQTVEIAAANYYLGIFKSDPTFWGDWGTGPQDPCGDQLPPYTDTYPSPPAQPQWHDFLFCDKAPAFVDPNSSSPAPITMQYMWNAARRSGNVDAADLTVWIKRDASSPVYEYHALRYKSPNIQPPSPYASAATPSPSPEESSSPPGSPTPGPSPSPSGAPSPSPSPTGYGV